MGFLFQRGLPTRAFTMTILGSQSAIYDGQHEQPDLIVRVSNEDLTNIFWADANSASNYMQGEIKVQGSI
jgi:putative sterol carrier protein